MKAVLIPCRFVPEKFGFTGFKHQFTRALIQPATTDNDDDDS